MVDKSDVWMAAWWVAQTVAVMAVPKVACLGDA